MKKSLIYVVTDGETPLYTTTSFADAKRIAKALIKKEYKKTTPHIIQYSNYWEVSHPECKSAFKIYATLLRTIKK